MPRKGNVPVREVLPDPLYNDVKVSKLINNIMLDGKKGVAQRICMVVIFPSILSEFVGVFFGSLIIEKMFAINGVGGLYLNSITFQDYDFFMLLSGFQTLIGLTAGIVIDISYGFIDPRIRMGAK